MAGDKDNEKDRFLYPSAKYRGKFTPENLVFNANLQEFGQRVSYLCSLETSGKLSSEETYHQIKNLWQVLKESRENIFQDEDSSNDGPTPNS